MIQFEDPIYVWLSAIFIVGALLQFVLQWVRGHYVSGRNNALFLFVIAVLLAILSNPYLSEKSDGSRVSLFVDVSESMNERVSASFLKSYIPDEYKNQIDVFAFEGPGQVRPVPLEQIESGDFSNILSRVGQTDISQISGQSIGGKVLLLSDGYETRGDIVESLSSGGSAIYPLLPAEGASEEEGVILQQLTAPLTAESGKRVPVQLSALNTSGKDVQGMLSIEQDNTSLLQQRVLLRGGQSKVFQAESQADKAGISKITATFVPDDKSQSRKSLTRYITRLPEESILLLNGAQEDGRYIETILARNGYKLTTHTSRVPEDIMRQGNIYKAVLLNNISNEMLGDAVNSEIADYVTDGGSLIMIGGNRSFGLGGYQDTPIARTLPVKLKTPKREQKRLNVAVELVLDKSRSMSFGSKIEYAKEAAREVIRNLKDEDYIGVIGFDTTPFIAFPLRRLAENRAMALSRVGSLFPVGRTNLFPAIDEARRSLVQVDAGRKHMIILTDGKIPDGGPHYLDLVENMRTKGITVSTVMMGSEADTGLLRSMAQRGGGAFYQTADARSLPRIFLSDIKVSTGEKTMREQRDYVVRKGSDPLLSTALQRFPNIQGYVQTEMKENAREELIAFAAGTGEPLLASWQYESGKSAAFTSDVSGRWTPLWIRWQLFDRFWLDLLRTLETESGKASKIEFDLRHTIKHGKLSLELSIYNDVPASNIKVTVTPPQGESTSINFLQKAPGSYSADVPVSVAGKHTISISLKNENLPEMAIDVPASEFGEQQGRGYNAPFLYELSAKSGGEVNPELQKLFVPVDGEQQKLYIGHWLFLLAALLFFIRIFFRELRAGKISLKGRGAPSLT